MRKSVKILKLTINNVVLIVDEAHNIGGVCEETTSLDISDIKLDSIIKEMNTLKH